MEAGAVLFYTPPFPKESFIMLFRVLSRWEPYRWVLSLFYTPAAISSYTPTEDLFVQETDWSNKNIFERKDWTTRRPKAPKNGKGDAPASERSEQHNFVFFVNFIHTDGKEEAKSRSEVYLWVCLSCAGLIILGRCPRRSKQSLELFIACRKLRGIASSCLNWVLVHGACNITCCAKGINHPIVNICARPWWCLPTCCNNFHLTSCNDAFK